MNLPVPPKKLSQGRLSLKKLAFCLIAGALGTGMSQRKGGIPQWSEQNPVFWGRDVGLWYSDGLLTLMAFLLYYSCFYSGQSREVFRVNVIDIISKDSERGQALTFSGC